MSNHNSSSNNNNHISATPTKSLLHICFPHFCSHMHLSGFLCIILLYSLCFPEGILRKLAQPHSLAAEPGEAGLPDQLITLMRARARERKKSVPNLRRTFAKKAKKNAEPSRNLRGTFAEPCGTFAEPCGTLRNLAEPSRNLAEPPATFAEPSRNLAEPSRNLKGKPKGRS